MIINDYTIRNCNKKDLKTLHKIHLDNNNSNDINTFSLFVKNNDCFVLEKKEEIFGYVITTYKKNYIIINEICCVEKDRGDTYKTLINFLKKEKKEIVYMSPEKDLDKLIMFKEYNFKGKLVKKVFQDQDGILMKYVPTA